MKKLILVLIITLSLSISAHVGLVSPLGGGEYSVGESVNISWQIIQFHEQNNWDLYFSADGGSTWQSIALNLPVSQLNYSWTVPNNITTMGRLKVIQDNTGINYEDETSDFVITGTTGINDVTELAGEYQLFQNYPNPFNPTTVISYQLPVSGVVELSVYNLIGEKISTLVSGQQNPGKHSISWNAENNSSGIYFYVLNFGSPTEGFREIKKMILMK